MKDKHFDKIRYLSRAHVRHVTPYLGGLNSWNMAPHFGLSDNAMLKGDLLALVKRNHLMEWVFHSSIFAKQLESDYFRIIPLMRREYTGLEIRQIKYSFHTLMALGNILYVNFVDSDDYLRKLHSSDCLMIIRNGLSVPSDNVWSTEWCGEGGHLKIKIDNHAWGIFDDRMSKAFREDNEIFRMSYRESAFSCGVVRKESLSKRYRDFLFHLQYGRCAISDELMDYEKSAVDHIFPASKGGNNTLINLQLVNRKENNMKSNNAPLSSSACFSVEELERTGLDGLFPYTLLADRRTSVNPFGWLDL